MRTWRSEAHRASHAVYSQLGSLTVIASLAVGLVGCSGDRHPTAASPSTSATNRVGTRPKVPASASHTMAEFLNSDSDLSIFASIIHGTALERSLAASGKLTLFAPTNAAFVSMGGAALAALQSNPNRADIMSFHIGKTLEHAADLVTLVGATIPTLGGPVHVTIDGRTLKIGGAAVTHTDIITSNGIIHFVDALITAKSA